MGAVERGDVLVVEGAGAYCADVEQKLQLVPRGARGDARPGTGPCTSSAKAELEQILENELGSRRRVRVRTTRRNES